MTSVLHDKHGILQSFWEKTVAPFILNRDNHKCRICGFDKGLHVHTFNYNNPCVFTMTTLCSGCHKVIHSKNNENNPRRNYKTDYDWKRRELRNCANKGGGGE